MAVTIMLGYHKLYGNLWTAMDQKATFRKGKQLFPSIFYTDSLYEVIFISI